MNDKSPLDNIARLTPTSEDSECDANKNAQRPQIELASKLHDGDYAAMEKTPEAGDCVERGTGAKAKFVAD